MKIKIYGHLLHRDYPWSVGKLRTIKTMEATDAAMHLADRTVAKANERRERKRLRLFWSLAV